jgi:large subunit ribosomal protein L3
MATFLLGTKENMTQVFDEAGNVTPATVISVSPMTVTQRKSVKADGYTSVQMASGEQKEHRLSKALKGHLKGKSFRFLKEFRAPEEELAEFKVGDEISFDGFEEGDKITISGVSKGKGFQGVVKRHGFKGGPRTHGQKHSEREPGSIGAGGVQRVIKGVRMGGRMGGDRVTQKNIRVLRIDQENGKIYVSGALPGRKGTLLEIRKTKSKTA